MSINPDHFAITNMAKRSSDTLPQQGRKDRKRQKVADDLKNSDALVVETVPSSRPVWDESKHPNGLPILATLFQPGRYPITRNLMTFLSDGDIWNLQEATKGTDEQFYDNLQHVPPAKWFCDEHARPEQSSCIQSESCPERSIVKVCDGVRLKYNQRQLTTPGSLHGWMETHGPDHGICLECNKSHLPFCPFIHSTDEHAGTGLWNFPVKPLKSSSRIRKRCTCVEDAMKLNLCTRCRDIWFHKVYKKRHLKGQVSLQIAGSTRILVGDGVPTSEPDSTPPQKYKCYTCRGFLVGRPFSYGCGRSLLGSWMAPG